MGETVDIRRADGVATVVMHRDGRNAFAPDLGAELKAAFDQLGADQGTRVVVLTSEYEKYFSVGADLSAIAGIDRDAPDAEDQIAEQVVEMGKQIAAIETCPKPVIAAINGHALGLGCTMALCCDYRLMVDDGRTTIGLPETPIGMVPGAGGTLRLARLLGRGRALPLLLEGITLRAQEAEAVGLVTRAVAPGTLESEATDLASRLDQAATLALGLIKDSLNRGLYLPMEEAVALDARNFARAALSRDAAVGIMSFLAKQQPEFTGV